MLPSVARRFTKPTPERCQWAAGNGPAHVWNIADALGLGKGPDFAEVYAIDPRTVLQPGELKAEDIPRVATLINAPRELMKKLSQGVPELAEMDDPGNSWYFGERAEIFDYSLRGEYPTKSGFTSFILRDVLDKIVRGEVKDLPTWEAFQHLLSDHVTWPHRKTPFLFAGRMVEASMAALYTLERQGKVTGVLISSETSGGGDDD